MKPPSTRTWDRERFQWRAIFQDVRASARLLVRSPFVSLTSVLILALGIGAATTIFSVTDALLLNSVSYPGPGRLVMLWESLPQQKGTWRVASHPAFTDWRDQVVEFDGLAANRPWRPLLTDRDSVMSLRGAKVSAGFFSVLGLEPTVGRGFGPEDEAVGAPPVVVLSHDLWQRYFGGDETLLGAPIVLDDSGKAVTASVVGILPPGARISDPVVLETSEIFMPLPRDPSRGRRYLRVVGRLAQEASFEAVSARLETLAATHRELYPETNTDWGAEIEFLEEIVEAPVRPAIFALLAAVALVLLIACTNVGILMLAREVDRRQEIAVRQALGAGPLWIGRRLLTESVLLCGTSGLIGLALAHGGLKALEGTGLVADKQISLDLKTLAFTCVTCLATAMIFGLVPAIRATGTDFSSALRAQRRRCGDFSSYGLRRALVLSEIAVALVLLVTAGLMLNSFLRLIDADPGFDPRGALTLRLQLPRSLHPGDSEVENLMARLREQVENSPRVEVAGMVNFLPMRGDSFGTRIRALTESGPEEDLRIELRGVSHHYFRSMGIPMIEGRDLDPSRDEPRSVIILSKTTARSLWPGESAVGKRLYLDWGSTEAREVIGIVGDIRQHGVRAQANPTVYIPFTEAPHRTMVLIARAARSQATNLAPEIRDLALRLDHTFVIDEVQSLLQVVRGTTSRSRAQAVILGVFALVALVLAAGGVYSLVAYSIAQRRYDLGVRLALGAHPGELVKVMTTEGLRDAALGVGIGLAGSLLASRLLSGLLYGVGTNDPWTLASTSALLLGVVLIASYLPARDATKIDPASVLRSS